MSAAMAAYLVSAGSAPASKKEKAAEKAENLAAKQKLKKQEKQEKQEQLAAAHPAGSENAHSAAAKRTLRGKQRHVAPQTEPAERAPQAEHAARPVVEPVDGQQQAGAAASTLAAATPSAPATEPAAAVPAAEPAGPPPVVLDIPLPEMPSGPPPDLTQSVFSSSPVP
jgi:hypothetical protein